VPSTSGADSISSTIMLRGVRKNSTRTRLAEWHAARLPQPADLGVEVLRPVGDVVESVALFAYDGIDRVSWPVGCHEFVTDATGIAEELHRYPQ
jgi:hypothetical protein